QGVADARLKWPNDVVRAGRKLAGILIEMRAEAGGPCLAVIGIGLNIALSAPARARIERPSDDLSCALGHAVARNPLAAALLAAWARNDALAGQRVQIDLGARSVVGTARGVDEHGALVLDHAGGRERFLAGHVILL